MINYTSNVDKKLDYAKRVGISILGSSNSPELQKDIESIIFSDPDSKISYRSYAPEGKELAPGFLLLENVSNFVNNEFLKLNNISEELQSIKDKRLLKIKKMELYDKVQLIDMARILSDILHYGN